MIHDDTVYIIRAKAYEVEVIVDPVKWLGLEFVLYSSDGKTLSYDIDTDQYNIGDPDEREFADDIESQIINFLEHLMNHTILIGSKGRKLMMIIPEDDGYTLISRGRFLTSGSRIHKNNDLIGSGLFKPLK